MLKNNIIKYNDSAQIVVDAYDGEYERGVVNLNIINNTGINTGTGGRFLWLGGSARDITLVNNLYAAPNLTLGGGGTSAIFVVGNNAGSFRTISNNIWPSPTVSRWIADNANGGTAINIIGSPNRIADYYNILDWNALPQVLTDFQADIGLSGTFAPSGIATTSGARYAGVFTDYYGNARPLNAAWSVGAVD
jgi:hypothetical protein